MRYKSLILSFVAVWSSLARGSDLPIVVEGLEEYTIGYCVPIAEDLAVSAAHVIVNPRKLSTKVRFKAGSYECKKSLICSKESDICVLYTEAGWEAAKVTSELEGAATLRGNSVSIVRSSKTEVILGWEDWLELGMSGSGVYVDGKLLAVLSRIKRGEYAVGVRVAPFLKG